MAGLGGLPTPTAGPQPPPPWLQDGRRSSTAHHNAPPPPLSAGPVADPRAQAVAALHAGMAARYQEAQGMDVLCQDIKYYTNEYKKLREELGTALQNMTNLQAEASPRLQNETNLRMAAEQRCDQLRVGGENLEQEVAELRTSVMLLQGQLGVLEDEKVSLQMERESQEADWKAKLAEAEAGKATATDLHAKAAEELGTLRVKRFQLQEIGDALHEEVATADRKLRETEAERKDAIEKLGIVQDENASVQIKVEERDREITSLKAQIDTLEEQRHTFDTKRKGLINENVLQAAEIKSLTARCKTLAIRADAADKFKENIEKLETDLESKRTELREATDNAAELRSEHSKGIGRMQLETDGAIRDKRNMSKQMEEAQTKAASSSNALGKTEKALKKCKEEKEAQDRRCHQINQELEEAKTAAEETLGKYLKLKETVRQHEDNVKRLDSNVKRLEQELEEQRKENEDMKRQAREFGERFSGRKQKPAKEEASKATLGTAEDSESNGTQCTPSKPPSQVARLDGTSVKPLPAGHITPPPENDAARRLSDSGSVPQPSTPRTKESSTANASTQPSSKINFALPGPTSQKPISPKTQSPLTKPTHDATQPFSESRPNSGGKRLRDEDHIPDPRPAKQPPRGPSNVRSGGDRYAPSGQGGHSHSPPRPISNTASLYARR